MESMTQELDIQNYDLKAIKKLYNEATQSNLFLNQYTLLDVEESKKKLHVHLLNRYKYKEPNHIQQFVEASSTELINALFETNTEMVGVKNVIQDKRKLNPNFFQETYRIINIDSMYRENLWDNNYTYDSKTSTNMHVKLNDSLDNVITLELTNVCIPYTFYNIDSNNGNNYFYIQKEGDTDSLEKIEISSGYYSPSELISAVNAVVDPSFTFTLSTETNRVTIENNSGTNYLLIFYDYLDNTQSFANQHVNEYSPDTQSKINNNLGWFMGFRNINKDNVCLEYTVNNTASITSEAICFIPFTKYFMIVIDDLNKNQTNKGLVQISHDKQFINNTKYFKDVDLSLDRKHLTNATIDNYLNADDRTLTKNKLYSALQINNYRTNFNEKNSKLDANLINNVFAVVPFENKSLTWGTSIFTSDKNKFRRKYSGPVNITKMNVKLLDDKGNVLNLNGSEWSFSMISTHLYQY
tara:strand:+ start:1285 stop:2688 length:1404 start_codon:yes stop_codon:yes gene_type:complete